MSKGYSIKADNKPTLFSWDLETEFKNIEKWLTDGRHKNESDLNEKKVQLRRLRTDLFEIIQLKRITDDQIQRIFDLIKRGRSGVWETATTELGRLAFHFDEVKS